MMKELIINASESIDSDEVFKDILSLSIEKEEEQFLSDNRPINEYGYDFDRDSGYTIGGVDSGYQQGEPWIQTFSGKRFTPINPKPLSVVIQDIAHSLSMQCRFNGHTLEFYSVAEHSVLVSYLCDKKDQLWGLMHDASEYALCDLPSPLKNNEIFSSYKQIEKRVQKAICERFSLDLDEPESVKYADQLLLSTEAHQLLKVRKDWEIKYLPLPIKLNCYKPQDAKILFLNRFYELMKLPEFIQ